MHHTYIFFDLDKNIVREFNKAFQDVPNITSEQVDVIELIKSNRLTHVVSPANSYGYMDGGIDQVYLDYFKEPNIQTTVQKEIGKVGIKDCFKRKFLPVGSAIVVPTGYDNCSNLICAPTMKVPQRVSPSNVKLAFYGILNCVKNIEDPLVIGIPGLCTGVGGVSAHDFAFQMRLAYNSFSTNVKDPFGQILIREEPGKYVVTKG